MKIIDTNILLHNPNILEEIDNVIITIRVIEEIDGLKRNIDPEIAYKARRASHKILQHHNKIEFFNFRKNELTVDNELISFAKEKKWTVITNDLNIQIKCLIEEVPCEKYSKEEETYTGIKYLTLEFDENGYNKELEELLEGKKEIELKENQFLIVQNKDSTEQDTYGNKRFTNSLCFIYQNKRLIPLFNHFIKNIYYGTIKPRNAEQECLMCLLNNPNITIVLAQGGYGTGKTMLMTNFALQELEKGRINKIIYVPNNSYVDSTRETGMLPGELIDKEILFLGALIDLMGEVRVRDMIIKEQIEIVPMSVIRGRNFTNSIILVNEAQNLTEDHIKLLVARCGENTRIFFDGDIKQVDNLIFKNKNGLKLLTKLKDSPIFSKIFGTVKLVNIERSLTAQASAYLDDSI